MSGVSVENKEKELNVTPDDLSLLYLTALLGSVPSNEAKKRRRVSSPNGRLLTLEDAAPFLGRKDHWGVRYLIDHHELPFVQIGRNKFIDREDIDPWLKKHKHVVKY